MGVSYGYPLQQGSAQQVLIFRLVLSSDHVSPAIGLSPTVTLSKNGGTYNSAAGTVTEIGNGLYKLLGNAADRDTLGPLILKATAGTADIEHVIFQVVGYDPMTSIAGNLEDADVSMKSLSISNTDGPALSLTTSNPGDTALLMQGDYAVTTDGQMLIFGNYDPLITIQAGISGNHTAVKVLATGSGNGVEINAGTSGNALDLNGGSASGNGFNASANGASAGFKVSGGPTGNGAEFLSGATSGSGIKTTAQTLGQGIEAIGAGAGNAGIKGTGVYGVLANGTTSGARFAGTATAGVEMVGTVGTAKGLSIAAAATGVGLTVSGGGTSGDAVQFTATVGDGMQITGAGATNHDVKCNGTGTALVQISGLLNHTPQTGDNYARLGAPAGTNFAEDIALIANALGLVIAATTADGVVVADASKTGYALTADYDSYWARIKLDIDTTNAKDEYNIIWFKGSTPLDSADVEDLTLNVTQRDGTLLIMDATPTEIGGTGTYKYDATLSNRTTPGESAVAVVTATIDGATRTWKEVVGRDS